MALLSWIKSRGSSGELMVLKGLVWGAVVKEEYQPNRRVNSVLEASMGIFKHGVHILPVDSYITLE